MPTSWQLDCLEARINSLIEEINRVKEKQPLHAGSRSLYKSFKSLLQKQLEKIMSARSLFASDAPKDRSRLEDVHGVISEQLQKVTDLFRSCDRVDSSRIPFEILPSLSAAATALLGKTTHIVVHLSTAYNYEIMSLRSRFGDQAWRPHWHAPMGGTEDDEVLLMVFPSYEVGTTLLHAIAAHELAHEVARRRWDDIKSATGKVIAEVSREYWAKKLAYINDMTVPPPGVTPEMAHDRAYRLFQLRESTISERWVRETFSDLFAVRLVGPAFLGALHRISAGLPSSQLDDSHPPLAIRHAVISKYLKDEFPHIEQDQTWSILKDGDLPDVPVDIFTLCGIEICENIVDPLRPLLAEYVSPLADPLQVDAAVKMVQKCIDNLIPPSYNIDVRSEGDVATAFWLLLYATWRYRLSPEDFRGLCEQFGWSDETVLAEAAINSLLLHSLQNLNVRSRWSNTPEEARVAQPK